MRKTNFMVLIFLMTGISLFAQSNNYLRTPALNFDGTKLAFSYQGDIWTGNIDGTNPQRLTLHEAYEANPKWSLDSKYIAFESKRFGNKDIFYTDVALGKPIRLTHYSSNDNIGNWSQDGTIYFSTTRIYNKVNWDKEIFSVNKAGGTPVRMMDAYGDYPAVSPDGKFIAFVKGACRVAREAYDGPSNKDLWLLNTESGEYFRLTENTKNDFMPVWGDGNVLYFISSRDGKYNVYKLAIAENGDKSGNPVKLTNFDDFGVMHLSVSGDGTKMAMEVGTDVYVASTTNPSPKKVEYKLTADYRFDPVEKKTLTSGASELSVSPNGKLLAYVSRGEVFVTENDKKKSRAVNVSNSPYRDIEVEWVSDSTLIFLSDRDGQFDIYLAKSADEKETNIFKSLKHKVVRLTDTDEDELMPVVSNDYKKVVFGRKRGDLYIADIKEDGTLDNEKLLFESFMEIYDVSWSPDDNYIAYSKEDLYFNSEVFILPLDGKSDAVNVSMHPKSDNSPVWSKDGSKIAFVSERNNRNNDIWFVWLKKSDWLKSKEDINADDDDESSKKKETKKDDEDGEEEAKPEPIKIDFEDIHERLVQVTNFSGNESAPMFDKDNETIYFLMNSTQGKGQRNFFKIKYDGDDYEQVTKGKTNPSFYEMTRDHEDVYYTKRGGSINKLNLKSGKPEARPYKGKMILDHMAERNQVFEEAWRSLSVYFYDPEFHGQDWDGLKEKYKPLTMEASTYDDFREMFNLMLGQVNASHMGLYGSGPEKTLKERTGKLAIEVKPVANGVEVTHVVPNAPVEREGSEIHVGDVITSVNGEEITPNTNFYSLLSDTPEEKIYIQVKRKSGESEEVVIRPVRAIGNLLYEEYFKSRKELVDKYSNGRLGYIHIEGMDLNSFERFERELTASGYGKDGIVIDVRYNGGGWTTDYLLTVLNVRQHAYTIPRGVVKSLEKEHKKYRDYYAYSERLPYAWLVKPSIALCNTMSYSNAEIFSHAYKSLGIGKLVGEPTFGAVISTWGKSLLDGSFVRLPRRAWYVKATDKNQELGPAVPDFIVKNKVDQDFNGDDAQLKKAVEELLKQIDGKE